MDEAESDTMDGSVGNLVALEAKEEIIPASPEQLAKKGQVTKHTKESPSTGDCEMHAGGLKRAHESGSFDYDIEPSSYHFDNLQVALVTQPPRG